MRRTCTIIALFLAGTVCTTVCADVSLEAAEAAIRAAWDKLKSFSADIGIDAKVPLGETRIEVSATGTEEFLKDGDKTKYRQQITARTPEPMVMEGSAEMLFDGADLHMTFEYFGTQKTETTKPRLDKGCVPPGGGMLLSQLKTQLDLRIKPDTEVDGKKVYVIEGTPKSQPEGFTIHKVALYIDKEFGFLRKAELSQSETEVAATMTKSNIKVNPELPASRFIYVPPAPPPPPPPQTTTPPAPPKVEKKEAAPGA